MKLLISDLDGTLLNNNGDLPSNFNLFIEKIKERGYSFSIATARSPQNVSNLFKSVDLSYYAFCSDGAITTYYTNKKLSVIREDNLSKEAVFNIINLFNSISNETLLFFSTSNNDFRIFIINFGNIPEIVFSKLFPYRNCELISLFDIHKIKKLRFRALSILSENNNNFLIESNDYKCIVYPETRFKNINYFWHDFLPISTSKGRAVSVFSDSLKFDTIIALGNSNNDIELFNIADRSFCPKHSSYNLLNKCSDFIDKKCGDNFLTEVIKRIE